MNHLLSSTHPLKSDSASETSPHHPHSILPAIQTDLFSILKLYFPIQLAVARILILSPEFITKNIFSLYLFG